MRVVSIRSRLTPCLFLYSVPPQSPVSTRGGGKKCKLSKSQPICENLWLNGQTGLSLFQRI
jgi:hypothetical protein